MTESLETWPQYSRSLIDEVSRCIASGRVNSLRGDFTPKFESLFAKSTAVNFAVALSNGTVALELALRALGIGSEDLVVVPARSFVASVHAVITVGASPIFCDIDNRSGAIDLGSLERILRFHKVSAVIGVHVGGLPFDGHRVRTLCRTYDAFLIEDCAQAHGAKLQENPVGSFGDVAAWSFCQDKIISTLGEGGMITTDSKKIDQFVRSYKDHGKNFEKLKTFSDKSPTEFPFIHDDVGSNHRITEIQSVAGLLQLESLIGTVERRRQIAGQYECCINQVLSKFGMKDGCNNLCPELTAYKKGEVFNSYYRFYFRLPDLLDKGSWLDNRVVLPILLSHGVPASLGSCCEIYREKPYRRYVNEPLQNASTWSRSYLAMLCHNTLSDDSVATITQRLKMALSELYD